MGAVFSCIRDLFRSIGSCIMGVVNAIASGIKVVINGIVSVIGVLVSCLTCARSVHALGDWNTVADEAIYEWGDGGAKNITLVSGSQTAKGPIHVDSRNLPPTQEVLAPTRDGTHAQCRRLADGMKSPIIPIALHVPANVLESEDKMKEENQDAILVRFLVL
ncbi:hypothetical protein BDW62DRAFT_201453 [Aspergillus aurantiobrunneus]